jgi:hypothetical protein
MLIAVAVLVGVLVAIFRPEREPEYGGKRLSEWVDHYYDPISGNFSATNVTFVVNEGAVDAIRHIGTNAVPYLIRWIAWEPRLWRIKLDQAIDKLLRRPARSWVADEKHLRGIHAAAAFQAVGAEAVVAIPALCRLMNDPNARLGAVRAATALGGIGKEGLPPLISALTNRPLVHAYATEAIKRIGSNSPPKSDPAVSHQTSAE